MAKTVDQSDFDFESASNLIALLAQLANKAIQLDEVDAVVDTIGMRFCSNRSLTELLAASATAHPTPSACAPARPKCWSTPKPPWP